MKREIFFGLAATLISLLAVGPTALAGDCRTAGSAEDWRNIHVLPVNGDPSTNISITLSTDKADVVVGDTLSITFQADQECYLTLLSVGTSGKTIRLWPNQFTSEDNRVLPGRPRIFPGPQDAFRYRMAPPQGVERIVAYATSEKGKILAESEFQQLGGAAFKQFRGSVKDLTVEFQRNTDAVPEKLRWGSAQTNVCISAAPAQTTVPEAVPVPPPSSEPAVRPAAPRPAPQPAPQTAVKPSASQPASPRPSAQATRPSQFIPVTRPTPEPAAPSSVAQPVEERSPNQAVVPPETPKPGNLYCLAVGISLGKLKYCESDALHFVGALRSKAGLKDNRTRFVLGSQATYAGFVGGMKWLASQTEPEDSVIIYYNGHGTQIPDRRTNRHPDGKRAAYVLYHKEDRQLNWHQALQSKVILAADEFNALLKKIPARKKILVADACHSGGLLKEMPLDSDDLVSKYYALLDPDTGKEMWETQTKAAPSMYATDHEALMAACLKTESSYESPRLRASVFSHYLLEALNARKASDLQQAFENAKRKTIGYCLEASRRPDRKGKPLSQTPSLTDPHGFVERFTLIR